jgi:hypothetical protein
VGRGGSRGVVSRWVMVGAPGMGGTIVNRQGLTA